MRIVVVLVSRRTQIKEEDEGEEQSGHTHGHTDQDLRHIYARSNVTQDSVKALIAMHKNLPDEVGRGVRVWCNGDGARVACEG